MFILNKQRCLYIVALCFFLSACQPGDESSPAQAQPTPAPSVPVTSNNSYRYDQSLIQPVDTQILRSHSGLQRNIPGLSDSRVTYCESVNGQAETYSGVRDQKKYPLASLSKIFLSAWAVDKLGPQYQFENVWYLKKVSDGVYDAYFRANYDPVLNIEKMLYAMSLMKTQGVQKIRQLVIDETTRVYLSVLLDPHVELTEVPVSMSKSIENLKIILNSQRWGSQTERAKENLRRIKPEIALPNYFSVEQVIYSQSSKVKTSDYTGSVKFKSVPLLKYLKEVNVNSNNYMSDMLFNTLGGAQNFRKFQQSRLNVKAEDLQLDTGSGLAVDNLGDRSDNKATCVAVLKVLKFIAGLSSQLKFNLGHVLLTAGRDQGTYDDTQSLDFNQSIVLKTGRLYDVPALNVAGAAQLNQGTLFFAYMAHQFDNVDEMIYKNKRDLILKNLLQFYPMTPSYQTLKLDNIFF